MNLGMRKMIQIYKLLSCVLFLTMWTSCKSEPGGLFQPDFIEVEEPVGQVPDADERINVHIENFRNGRQRVGYEVMSALPKNLRSKFIYKKTYTRYHSKDSLLKGYCNNTILYTKTVGDETSEIFGCAGHVSEQHKY